MAKAKILGKLKGVIASAKENSRNGRTYTESFWDAKFNEPLFKEGLDNRVFFGELFHPDDENEYNQIHCDDRSAVVLTDVKKQDKEYIGTFDILPTKAGQCLRNLLDIGCIFGVSSRGLADYDTERFDETMAPNYDLITWDIVAFPGIKSCRLHEVGAVAEGFNNKRNVNKTKIMESLNQISNSDPDFKNYITKTLKLKEDFNSDLQVEDIMANYNIPDDLYQYGNYVKMDKNNLPYYDDGEHGLKQVMYKKSPFNRDTKPGDIYMVDNIWYNVVYDKYLTSGEWIKISN